VNQSVILLYICGPMICIVQSIGCISLNEVMFKTPKTQLIIFTGFYYD